jgi:hypothetical protein
MKLGSIQEEHMDINNIKGSITLESCIIVPVFLCIILMLVSVYKCIVTWENVQASLYKTSSILCDYAVLYHKNGLINLENFAFDKFSQYTDGLDDLELLKYINTNDILNTAESTVYSQMAKFIFDRYYGAVKTHSELETDFGKSKFFNENQDITLMVTYKIKVDLPVVGKFFKGIILTNSVKSRAWIGGSLAYPTYSEDENIWELDNFTRGRLIGKKYGRNLPDKFPCIAIFNKSSGEAAAIKSLNITAKSYESKNVLKNTLNKMADDLYIFNGGTSGDVTVNLHEIKKKKLILVIPDNEMGQEYSMALNDFQAYCYNKNILLEIIKYGTAKTENAEAVTDAVG